MMHGTMNVKKKLYTTLLLIKYFRLGGEGLHYANLTCLVYGDGSSSIDTVCNLNAFDTEHRRCGVRSAHGAASHGFWERCC